MKKTLAAFLVIFSACRIFGSCAEPYLKWVFVINAITTDAELAHFEEIAERAGKCGYNGVVWDAGKWTNGVDFRWDAARLDRMAKARLACRKAGLEIVPMLWSVGRAMAIVDRDPTLAETDTLRQVPYVACGGRAVFAPTDDPVVFKTNGTIRVEKPGIDKVNIAMKVKPRTKYRLTALADTAGVTREAVSTVKQRPVRGAFLLIAWKARNGRAVGLPREVFPCRQIGTVRDMEICFDFMTQENDEEVISLWVWKSAHAGEATFRGFKVTEIGVANPVIREGSPFVVRRAADGRAYVPGRDYTVPESAAAWRVCRHDKALEIELPKGSAIAEGEKLEIDYASALVRSPTQIGACMANPALYRFFDETAPEIDRLFGHPKRWFLSMDEVRSGGTCGLCRSDRPENLARLIAMCMTHQRDAIRRVRPDAQIFAWSDMYDPHCNAKVDPRGYALCRGDFAFTAFRVPKDIVSVVWECPPMAKGSFDYFAALGVPILHGTYYDVDTLEHPRCRGSIELDREYRRKGACIGTMYTTWHAGGHYALLEGFAELMEDLR